MFGKIRGAAGFKASGNKLYPFINAIRESSIACTSQRCHNGNFYGCVYMSDMRRLSELAEEYNITLEYTEKKGAAFRLHGYRFRFGIIGGLAAVVILVFYLSNIVVSVEVNGNSGVSREQIVSALSEIGIYKGRLIADIDFHKCEQKLRLSIPEISWTGIRHTGSRIVVDVAEADPPPEMVKDSVPCNIVADKDAQIISIELYSGRKMKIEGSGVRQGEIIISGIVDDGGGHTLKKHAMGKIVGRYEEKVQFEQPFSTQTQVYTGEEVTKKYFEFFGFRIPLFIKKAEFQSFDRTETSNSFMFLGKKLPFGMVCTTYTPFEYDTASYTAEEADVLLQQKITTHEKNFYDSKGIEVEKREISKKSLGDKMTYDVKYTLVGEIGRDYEIFADRTGRNPPVEIVNPTEPS